ncbi:acyl-CoA synthetase FdrA [Selenihalanaerobacter shriftii]|uniref:Succinyl-CoA synthetase, alpha subunit n=1 Tax=Selenihalanaerobacter shriftii TaxID=142842 RepID=A0A1T4JSU3_9FIRM|nr:acyl-CoA synthetase FdrA [Selenihalanaerobacter shriftii]SJZ33213.1 Succinyl-CoA synthetase, alpha subunit [Selenihalanaerobacter shriftii]
MAKKVVIDENNYYDSVTLMSISKDIKGMEGMTEAVVVMATPHNKELLENVGLLTEEADNASPKDMVVAIEADTDELAEEALNSVTEALEAKASAGGDEDYRPRTLDSALDAMPGANLAIVSVPGDYAKKEAEKALNKGLHVMLFSDNVPVEEEIELKELAAEKGLLLMGPDCGTAVINNKPLAFSNVVSEGNIGLVAASGTGAQEVSTIIDKSGLGVSQVIGTGGRDLSTEVGGREMLKGLKALAADDSTEVIVLVSKPPADEVVKKILAEVDEIDKPVVVNFLGGNEDLFADTKAIYSSNLEEAALKAVALSEGEEYEAKEFTIPEEEVAKIVEEETAKYSDAQKYLRGLYTGGTLCDESMLILADELDALYSNIPLKPEWVLEDNTKSQENTALDLGEDEFTQGRPHPMIEPFTRVERVEVEAEDEEMAILLADVVLGYGSHENPAGELAEAIKEAKEKAEARGGHLTTIVSVCGTANDPQDLEEQTAKLEEVGAIVMPSNAQAARLAAKIVQEIN